MDIRAHRVGQHLREAFADAATGPLPIEISELVTELGRAPDRPGSAAVAADRGRQEPAAAPA